MRFTQSRMRLLPVLAMLSSVSACASSVVVSPPVADLQAVTETKPVPSDAIATSDQAAADYDASLEAWGDRISAAGGRLCRWSKSVYKLKVDCPKD